MSKNVDLLLEKLPQDSLTHKLVSELREADRDKWPEVLAQFLKSRFEEKVKELAHAADQASGD